MLIKTYNILETQVCPTALIYSFILCITNLNKSNKVKKYVLVENSINKIKMLDMYEESRVNSWTPNYKMVVDVWWSISKQLFS